MCKKKFGKRKKMATKKKINKCNHPQTQQNKGDSQKGHVYQKQRRQSIRNRKQSISFSLIQLRKRGEMGIDTMQSHTEHHCATPYITAPSSQQNTSKDCLCRCQVFFILHQKSLICVNLLLGLGLEQISPSPFSVVNIQM